MSMHQAWALWSGNQPERIAEAASPKPQPKMRPSVRLDQLNERILSDIGMSKLGIPVAGPGRRAPGS
jgi:hypothetical protein